jgi:hypothetical protein
MNIFLLLLLYRLFLFEEKSHTILTEIFNKNSIKEKSQRIKGLIGFKIGSAIKLRSSHLIEFPNDLFKSIKN